MDHIEIISLAKREAYAAATALLKEWYDGKDSGMCGFAWVTIYPKHKGNTRDGRKERKVLREMGFELDWTGKSFQWWNPSGLGVQNVDSKYKGAVKAAEVLKQHGFDAFPSSRLD